MYLDDVWQTGVITDESLHLRERSDDGIVLIPEHTNTEIQACLNILCVCVCVEQL